MTKDPKHTSSINRRLKTEVDAYLILSGFSLDLRIKQHNMAEAELIRKVIAGDRGACYELCNLYKKNIFYLCLKILRNREDAEETMNEIFFKAIESIIHFRAIQIF